MELVATSRKKNENFLNQKHMKPEDFITAYETALASQDWKMVEPLIAETASVTFSNGAVHIGKGKVQRAFENNFATIKSEHYAIENVIWLKKESMYAVYLFEFSWTRLINSQLFSGSGIGTSVILKEGDNWKLLTEHLGKK